MTAEFPLSPPEITRQREIMAGTRMRQAGQLALGGVVDQVLASQSVINLGAESDPMTEATDLWVFRRDIDTLSGMKYGEVRADISLTHGKTMWSGIELVHRAAPDPGRTWMYCIGRCDETPGRRVSSSYVVGYRLGAEVAEVMQHNGLLESNGVALESVALIEAHLQEIDAIRREHDLTTISPESLAEDEAAFRGY
jgi:hypothetical protein